MSNTLPLNSGPPTLAHALRSQPIPPASADFDDRVLAALRVPIPWWRRWWQPVQPLLLGASGSLAVTLLLLHFTLTGPQTAPAPTSASVQNLAAAPPISLPSVDALLDRPGLCAGSLTATWNSSPLLPDAAPEPAPRKPEPRRRAQVNRRSCLTA